MPPLGTKQINEVSHKYIEPTVPSIEELDTCRYTDGTNADVITHMSLGIEDTAMGEDVSRSSKILYTRTW